MILLPVIVLCLFVVCAGCLGIELDKVRKERDKLRRNYELLKKVYNDAINEMKEAAQRWPNI